MKIEIDARALYGVLFGGKKVIVAGKEQSYLLDTYHTKGHSTILRIQDYDFSSGARFTHAYVDDSMEVPLSIEDLARRDHEEPKSTEKEGRNVEVQEVEALIL